MPSALATPADLRGNQLPRISAVPEYDGTTGDEAVELAAMAGLNLLPWQQWVLRHSLGERDGGKWAAFEVGLVVGRQNGKNAILEARELAELYLVGPMTGPRLIIHSAHQFKTALEHFRRMKRRILDTPELLKRVKGPIRKNGIPAGIRDSHGEESIELIDGSRLMFQARTSSGGQGAGFTADLLVWDEAWNLPDSVIGFVLPTLSAKTLETPGVQVWYTSQAVNQQTMPYGVHLARVRERGIAGEDPSIFFAEWSVDDVEFAKHPELADDPAALAQANPSLGYLIALEHVRRERAGAMPWIEYLIHRLGVGDWPPTSDDEGRVISVEQWKACECTDPTKRIVGPKTFAVDVAPGEAFGSIAVAGERDDGLFHLAVVEHQAGTGWIKPMLKGLLTESGSRAVADGGDGPAAAVVQDLVNDGLLSNDDLLSTKDYGLACKEFFNAVTQQVSVRYPVPQPDLDAAVGSARTTPLEGAWKWSRKSSTSPDISPLIAATLALWGHRNAEPEFATVLYASDHEPAQPEQPARGPKLPQVVSQEEQTVCFACSQGGHCPAHGG